MKIKAILAVVATAAVAMLAAESCTMSYDVEKSNELVRIASADTILSQSTYSQMIATLNRGYSYMKSRLAKAAFESNPTAAVNDIINILGDSTLSAVHSHSAVLIESLSKAPLDKRNEKRFREVLAKYMELDASLTAGAAPADTTAAGEVPATRGQ